MSNVDRKKFDALCDQLKTEMGARVLVVVCLSEPGISTRAAIADAQVSDVVFTLAAMLDLVNEIRNKMAKLGAIEIPGEPRQQ